MKDTERYIMMSVSFSLKLFAKYRKINILIYLYKFYQWGFKSSLIYNP